MTTPRPKVPVSVSPDRLGDWIRLAASRINAALMGDGAEEAAGPVKLKEYVVADLPSASVYAGCIVRVSDETGGDTVCMSNGTNWVRLQDLNTAS